MTDVIGLIGAAGSGKSAAADELERMGYTRVRFSQGLKDMLRAFYRFCGLDGEEIERRIEGDLKEVADPLLGGKTPRHAMQTLGTEWGRVCISPTIWTDAWEVRAQSELSKGRKVVAEDVRFATEDVSIRKLDGKIVKITGRAKTEVVQSGHVSENFDGITVDMTIANTGTLAELKGAVNYVFRDADEVDHAA